MGLTKSETTMADNLFRRGNDLKTVGLVLNVPEKDLNPLWKEVSKELEEQEEAKKQFEEGVHLTDLGDDLNINWRTINGWARTGNWQRPEGYVSPSPTSKKSPFTRTAYSDDACKAAANLAIKALETGETKDKSVAVLIGMAEVKIPYSHYSPVREDRHGVVGHLRDMKPEWWSARG